MPDGFVIDSTRKGNFADYINHSCKPNCIAWPWNHQGVIRIFIFAQEDIEAESELTYDYREEFNESEIVKCLCGSGVNFCSGIMGISKKELNSRKKLKRKVLRWK